MGLFKLSTRESIFEINQTPLLYVHVVFINEKKKKALFFVLSQIHHHQTAYSLYIKEQIIFLLIYFSFLFYSSSFPIIQKSCQKYRLI